MPQVDQTTPEELFETLAELKRIQAGKKGRAVDLVLRVIRMIDSDPEVLAFVNGLRSRGSVQRSWGDNDRSFWAHLYPVPRAAGGTELLVTLERDGGVSAFIGIFDARESALTALASMGKYEEL
jgi:hypothetical protein